MAFAVGPITQVSVSYNSDSLSCAAATGGTGPYTYQWYRSTTSGFSPGSGNLISGATSLTLNDTGLIPNTTYYYKVVATDTGNSNVTVTSAQLTVVTSFNVLNQNQFNQVPYVGMIDQRYPYSTTPVQIDLTQVGNLYAGSPVKVVPRTFANGGSIPSVVGCTLDTDNCFGFINYDIKSISFAAGAALGPSAMAEVSQAGNVIYLYSTTAITQGTQVILDVVNNGVAQATGSTNNTIIGWAFDGFSGPGQLGRVRLVTPSFLVD